MKNNNLLFTNRKKLIAIVSLTFILFAISGYGWHFYKEEIDLLYAASKIKSFKDLFTCFLFGNVSGNAHPTNYISAPLTFLTSFYRPLLFIIAFVEYSLIGMQPYTHYLISIGLHCINIPLVFYLLSGFVGIVTATICAMLFALHPSYATWIGSANMQQYTISTTCIMILALLVKKYIDQRHKKFLIGALLLFAITLFIRETIIVVPMALFWLSLMSVIDWKKTLQLVVLLGLATLPYLMAKLLIFPLAATGTQPTSFTNFYAKTSLFVLQVKLFVYDFLSTSWFPDGYPKAKACLVFLLLLGLIALFVTNTRKRSIIATLGCMALLLWPAIMIGYFVPSRFFYEATPAYLLAIALLIDGPHGSMRWPLILSAPPCGVYRRTRPALTTSGLFHAQKIAFIIIIGLVMCSTIYTAITIRQRTIAPAKFYNAIMKLKNCPTIQNNPLCFFGLTDEPSWTGLAQQLWLYKINNEQPIFILIPTEQPYSGFPSTTTFVTWDYRTNEFYVLPHATSNEAVALLSQNEKPV